MFNAKEREHYFMLAAVRYVLLEHYNNASRIWKLARDNTKRQVMRTTLGVGWIVFHDLVYFAVFIIVRYLIAGAREINGVVFIVYMLVGLITWFFMSDIISSCANSIKRNKAIIDSINFPTIILPTIEVLAIVYKRLFSIGLMLLVVWAFGYTDYVQPLLLLYYFLSMIILMIAFSLTFSAITAISHDFEQLYRAFTRILILSVPIL